MVKTKKLKIETKGNCDVVDITDRIADVLSKHDDNGNSHVWPRC